MGRFFLGAERGAKSVEKLLFFFVFVLVAFVAARVDLGGVGFFDTCGPLVRFKGFRKEWDVRIRRSSPGARVAFAKYCAPVAVRKTN